MGRFIRRFLPNASNKKILAAAFGLAMFGSTFLWLPRQNDSGANAPENSAATIPISSITPAELARDENANGIPDWQDALNGLYPTGEGISDAALSQTSYERPDPHNLTYDLAKRLFESGVLDSIDAGGQIVSEAFVQNFLLPDGLSPDALLERAPTITASRLRVSNDNSPVAVRRYFERVTGIERARLDPRTVPSDLLVLITAIDANDLMKLRALDATLAALDNAIADLEALAVPSDYQNAAVEEINYLIQTRFIVNIFRHTADDPLATIVVFRKRIQLLDAMAQSHLKLSEELYAKGLYE